MSSNNITPCLAALSLNDSRVPKTGAFDDAEEYQQMRQFIDEQDDDAPKPSNPNQPRIIKDPGERLKRALKDGYTAPRARPLIATPDTAKENIRNGVNSLRDYANELRGNEELVFNLVTGNDDAGQRKLIGQLRFATESLRSDLDFIRSLFVYFDAIGDRETKVNMAAILLNESWTLGEAKTPEKFKVFDYLAEYSEAIRWYVVSMLKSAIKGLTPKDFSDRIVEFDLIESPDNSVAYQTVIEKLEFYRDVFNHPKDKLNQLISLINNKLSQLENDKMFVTWPQVPDDGGYEASDEFSRPEKGEEPVEAKRGSLKMTKEVAIRALSEGRKKLSDLGRIIESDDANISFLNDSDDVVKAAVENINPAQFVHASNRLKNDMQFVTSLLYDPTKPTADEQYKSGLLLQYAHPRLQNAFHLQLMAGASHSGRLLWRLTNKLGEYMKDPVNVDGIINKLYFTPFRVILIGDREVDALNKVKELLQWLKERHENKKSADTVARVCDALIDLADKRAVNVDSGNENSDGDSGGGGNGSSRKRTYDDAMQRVQMEIEAFRKELGIFATD